MVGMKGVDTIARIQCEFFTRGRVFDDIVRDLRFFLYSLRGR